MRRQNKKLKPHKVIWIYLLCISIVSCASESESSTTVSNLTNATPYITVTASSSTSLLPANTAKPPSIVFPITTMSPKEAELALQKLMETNGNCTGKCMAGIYPDEMTMQEGVSQMAQWGTIEMSEDNNGTTFVHLIPPAPHDKLIRINLVLIIKQQAINGISFHIPRWIDGNEFVDADVWQTNREAWAAFRLDNLLKAYGTPSFVGFSMETGDPKGETIIYTLDIHYEDMNLQMGFGGLAQRNGQDVFICPTSDSHNFGININPQRPLGEVQQFSRITWQALTGGDLQTFYDTFIDESNSDGCVVTTLSKIMELDPYFR